MRSESRSRKPLAAALALAAAVVAVDLAAKAIAERSLDEPVGLFFGVDLRLGHNPGVAFGVLDGIPMPAAMALALLLISALALAVDRSWLPIPWPGLGLLVGGAVANLVDRGLDGEVTDFIDPPHLPAFNLAEVAMALAIVTLLLPARTWAADQAAT